MSEQLDLVESLSNRVSFHRFCGLPLNEGTPDETSLCPFRDALERAGLGDGLLAEIGRQLDAAGFVVRTGR